jgi:phosphatidylinositol alpha-mannosyltransferase
VASDLPAFAAVLDEGRTGVLFETGSPEALAGALLGLVSDPERMHRLRSVGQARAAVFDWGVVADRIMAVYETVIAGADGEPEEPTAHGLWGRLVRGVPGGGN